MANNVGGANITPKQLEIQWKTLPNKFDVNVWNFEIKAGKAAVGVFQESFHLARFNSASSLPWSPRKDRKKHPLLQETGSLKRSIKWKHSGQRGGGKRGVSIYTDPNGFRHIKRNKGFCSAAIHNSPTGSFKNSVQRQLMGYSTTLNRELEKLESILFNGFPK